MCFFLVCAIILPMEENIKTFNKRNFYTSGDSARVFLFAFLLPILFALVFSYIGYAIAGALNVTFSEGESFVTVLYENYLWFSIPYMLLSQVTFVCIFFVYNKVNRITFSACKLSVKKISPITTLFCVLFGIVFVVGLYGLIEGCFGELFSMLGLSATKSPIPLDNFWWYLLNILLLGIIPAFVEELIFRGVIFSGLKRSVGKVGAIFLSALVFALMHQNISSFLYPFIMGVAFSLVFEYTGNLFYTMLFHLFNNITTITIEYLVNNNALTLPKNINAVYIIVSIILMLVVFALFFLFYFFYLRSHKCAEQSEQGEFNDNAIFVGKLPLLFYLGLVLSTAVVVINIFV